LNAPPGDRFEKEQILFGLENRNEKFGEILRNSLSDNDRKSAIEKAVIKDLLNRLPDIFFGTNGTTPPTESQMNSVIEAIRNDPDMMQRTFEYFLYHIGTLNQPDELRIMRFSFPFILDLDVIGAAVAAPPPNPAAN
jgi:hypothetical protein